jgi:hypothetical protein
MNAVADAAAAASKAQRTGRLFAHRIANRPPANANASTSKNSTTFNRGTDSGLEVPCQGGSRPLAPEYDAEP